MSSDAVLFEVDGDIAVLTINRPDVRNAVDGPTAGAICASPRPTLCSACSAAGGAFR